MNYYYDILVNPEEEFYEFYEWEKDDDITAIKKVPLYKVEHKIILDFLQYEITVNKDILENIKEKTITKNKKERLNGMLLSDSKTSLYVELDLEGNVIYRSKLLIEDENNINEISTTLSCTDFLYQKKNSLPKRKELRRTVKEKKMIMALLNSLEKDKNKEKCFYLYYEWFHTVKKNDEECLKEMKEQLNTASISTVHRIANLISLISKEKLS